MRLVTISHGGESLVALVIDKLVFPPVPSAKVLQQEYEDDQWTSISCRAYLDHFLQNENARTLVWGNLAGEGWYTWFPSVTLLVQ